MPLPQEQLDKPTFTEIFDKSRKKISANNKNWSDHNFSDPGITFLDLLSWIADTQLYSANRTKHNYKKYLSLLGETEKHYTPDELNMVFSSKNAQKLLPGTKIVLQSDTHNVFELNHELDILEKIPTDVEYVVRENDIFTTITSQLDINNDFVVYPFGEKPKHNNSFYIGLPEGIEVSNKVLTMLFSLQENNLEIYPYGVHGEEISKICVSPKIRWECYTDSMNWQDITSDVNDETLSMTKSGTISFKIPSNIQSSTINSVRKYWLKCTFESGRYINFPKIKKIYFNVVKAVQGLTIEKEHAGISTGLPYQSFSLEKYPVLDILELKSTKTSEKWTEITDFDGSTPSDRHFVLNRGKGTIHFGDGINGKIPTIEDSLIVTYKFSKYNSGKVPSNSKFVAYDQYFEEANILNTAIEDVEINNYEVSKGGIFPETIEDAFKRTKEEISIPFKAVTSNDFIFIAKNTPGLRVARVGIKINKSNTVSVVIIPYSDEPLPIPTDAFLHTVCQHLDKHRLITTKLKMLRPNYIGITVKVKIKIQSNSDDVITLSRIKKGLKEFLNPISMDPNMPSWPFGRNVYRSEIIQTLETILGVGCVLSISLQANGPSRLFSYKNKDVFIKNYETLVYLKEAIVDFEPAELQCIDCSSKEEET